MQIKKILACAIILSLCASCSPQNKKENESGKINIVTTVFPLYDFARQIAGDKAEVTMLLPTGAETHSYEPTARDIIKIKESELFINVGGSADPWTEAVANDADGKKINMLSASDFVEIIKEEHEEGHSHEEHEEELFDDHVWTSVRNSVNISEAIVDELCKIDEKNAQYYKENGEKLSGELNELDSEFTKTVSEAKRKYIVFADRFPVRYFARDYSLEYYAAFPGCSSESEPSARVVAEIIEKVKKEKIPAVFYTETSNKKMAETVCAETGAEKLLFHSCHTVNKNELDDGVTYVKLMKKNLEALKIALG